MYNAHNRQHYFTKQKVKNNWTRLVGDSLFGQIPAEPFKIFKLTLTRFSEREPDYDGLVSSWKYVIDALRYYKVIEDDCLSNTGPWDCRWEKTKRGQGKIHIVVEKFEL